MNSLATMRHPVLGDVTYSTQAMSYDPDTQVEQAIAQMSRYAIADASTPDIQADSALASSAAGGDPVLGAWQYARRKLRFCEDSSIVSSPEAVEVLIRPVDVSVMSRTLGTGSVIGDCDDFSMYVASLLLAAGVPCCFATVAADSSQPDSYSHVYVVAYPSDGVRIAVDASHGKECGWEAPNQFGKMREWDLFESSTLKATSAVNMLVLLGALALGYWWFNSQKWSAYDA